MTSVLSMSRQQTALKLLQDNRSRDAGRAETPAPANRPSGLGGNNVQQDAVARISKLLLEGAWSNSGFLMVMPSNARIVEGGSGNDVVNIASAGNGRQLNYVSLGDGNDLLNLVSAGDATSDYWQGNAMSIASAVSDSVDAKIGVMVPDGQGIFAGAGNDIVNIAAGRDAYAVSGNDGHDLLNVAAGQNASGIWGGDGHDVLAVAGGMDVDNVTGDAGDDIVTVAAGRQARNISGGEGRDVLTVAAGQTVSSVYGGRGSDIINVAGGQAAHYISGDDGNDAISVVATTVDHVEGGSGDDAIAIKARTAEAISGGRGNDTIDLTGTDKASVFFDRGDGQDLVRVAGETTIVFAGRSIDDAAVSYGDGTITISFADNGDSVTLDYSATGLKGSKPELSLAKAGRPETAPESRAYSAYHGASGFSLTLR
jgi:uncharacterized protein YaiE (UPF0345 family)